MPFNHKAPNGTITFTHQVQGQDVYAAAMSKSEFNKLSGSDIAGDDEPGFAFLIREKTTLRWSKSPTGKHIPV